MEKKTLAIMAAGMGSRFGSLKQLHPIHNEYSIMDYSIYDAIQAGYNHLVFIIRAEILEPFQKRYLNTLPKHISVDFAIQKNEVSNYQSRKKPWGTGHALLALKNLVTSDFTLINADDFYGKTAFKLMYKALFTEKNHSYYLIAYPLKNTLSEHGSVSRGICKIDENNQLLLIEEYNAITKNKAGAIYYKLNSESKLLNPDCLVSMNFWGFKSAIFDIADDLFQIFLTNISDREKDEFYITYIINHLIKNTPDTIKVLTTKSHWFGITYLLDEPVAQIHIQNAINTNEYPENLW